MLDYRDILFERLTVQRFHSPVRNASEVEKLFRLLQPVCPIYFSYPCSPPNLRSRVKLKDENYFSDLREDRKIGKGRFQKSRVGYVYFDDFPVYAKVFRKSNRVESKVEKQVYRALEIMAPTDTDSLKEETKLLKKQILPALHKMQERFVVFEDQQTSSWERPWVQIDSVFDDFSEQVERADGNIVFRHFFGAQIFSTERQLMDWSGLSKDALSPYIRQLINEETIIPVNCPELGGEGWAINRPFRAKGSTKVDSVFMLDQNDSLVLCQRSKLKRDFEGYTVLQYLLIEGMLVGAVCGHWRIRAHNVDDIVLLLPKAKAQALKGEILEEVGRYYSAHGGCILKYCGKSL